MTTKSKVLLIEDNEQNRYLATYLLEHHGYEVVAAEDGGKGLTMLPTANADLILLDIQLPDMDGYEVARQIKRDRRIAHIPLVAISSFAMPGDRAKAFAAGCDGYIEKPLDPDRLVRQLQPFLRRTMKTLVVDDAADNRYLLELLLQAHGHEVVAVNDGAAALEKLGSERFDLVISDIMMPRMDGFELCYNLKLDPKLRHIPFIFYTATYTSDEDRAFALSLGADAFILKPEEPESFVERLTDALKNAGSTHTGSSAPRLTQDHLGFLKEYNVRLVRKLEEKIAEAQHANRMLHEVNATLEQRVAEKTGQLERSNHELESFAHTLSHDLRAPLRSIAGYAEALQGSAAPKLAAEERSWLAKICSAAQRMERMIADVLSYSRAVCGPVPPQPTNVEAIVRDLIGASADYDGRVEITTALEPMHGHEPSLRQAISNLLANAIKFVPPGVEPRVRIYSERIDGQVRLWVEDNGIGIALEQQPEIFGLFQRLHPKYEGSGIGLAIVARAMERMHGSVGVESEPGKGSRFWLQLPAV